MKHPLQNAWTLWFYKNDKSRSWDENQKAIITVDTVEDFWSLYNHIEVDIKISISIKRMILRQYIYSVTEVILVISKMCTFSPCVVPIVKLLSFVAK